ncbi:MAG: aldehyde dehydrogenase (NADP(+)) [Flavobacteriaceae bacterium]|nr:aldehyde dehydrogenase (NADP(+)) [Flavobacteriaceae bacterium]
MITGKNIIGNELMAAGTISFKTINPQKNEQNPWEIIEATTAEVHSAAELAAQAFPIYSNKSGKERAAFLIAIAEEIEALGDGLFEVYSAESGLPIGRAQGERGRTVGQLRAFAAMIENEDWRNATIETALPDRQPMPKPDLRKTHIPLGPIAVFGASNFPLAFSTAGGDTASALAAGCPVIVKGHPMHAATGELVAKAIVKAAERTGMPAGVFSNLNSKGIEVGQALVKHPAVKGVGFTGSIRGGRALYDLAATREEPIPVFAEMGSINPVIISEGAIANRAEALATTYAGSITLGTGQFCTNPGLLIGVASDAFTAFIEDLGAKTIAADPQCMLHPHIKENFVRAGESVSSQDGAKIVAAYGSEVQSNYAPAKIVTVSGGTFLKNTKLHQEVFGPFSMVVQCKDQAELMEIVSRLEGQLTGTIIAEKEEYASLQPLVQVLKHRVGRIIFNGVPTGVEVTAGMTHGGPYPASTDSRFTAVGVHAIYRWVRPFSYQDFPTELLPTYLK